MLAFFRKVLSSWLALALLGLVLVAFIVTGVGDPFGGMSGVRAGSVARVGDEQISATELAAQFDRSMRRARERDPALTNAQAASRGGVEEVLGQLVTTKALEVFGRDSGVAASDLMIDTEIASIPSFQLAGRFDQATYQAALAAQRLTDREVRAMIRGDAIRRQLLVPVMADLGVSQALAAPYAALLLEERRGAVGVVPSARMTDVPAPTDAQIQAFYSKNQRVYTIPERRAFRYALLSRDALAANVAVSDADIERYYKDNRETYGGIEQRTLSQVVVPDQAKAQQIVTRVRAGEPFEKVAAAIANYSAADLAVGTQTQTAFAGATNTDVARAAFSAAQGAVTDPIKSDFGWHVVRIDKIIPGRGRSLAEVRGEIVAKLRDERADDLLADAEAAIEDALTQGQSLADIAAERKLAIVNVPPITRDGRTFNAGDFRLDPRVAPLVTKVFDAETGGEPSVEELDKANFAIVDPGDVVAPQPVPLAQIRPAVVADWQRQQRAARAKAVADAIAADVRKGVPLATAFSRRNLSAPQTIAGRRIDIAAQGRVPPPVALMFTLPQGAVRVLEAPAGQGYFIVKVDQVTPGNPASDPMVTARTQQQIAQVVPGEFAEQFARAVEREVGVKRDASEIARLRQRYLDGGDLAAQ